MMKKYKVINSVPSFIADPDVPVNDWTFENLDSEKVNQLDYVNLLKDCQNILNLSDSFISRAADCATYRDTVFNSDYSRSRLLRSNFCRERFCPTDMRIRSSALYQKVKACLFALPSDYKVIFVTLTVPSVKDADSLRKTCSKMSAVEEAYELVDAIDQNDDEKVLEETGDILLQTVFHAVMKEETGAFNLTDVLTGICQKLITRHTHVFGEDKAKDESGALSVWEKNKMTEKHQVTYADSVNDVPKCFPAAMRAQKVGKRASKAGMDFASAKAAAERVKEELNEFFSAYDAGEKENAEKELGDVLFAAVNVGRKAGCDCEKALKEATERFAARFTLAEKFALDDGKKVETLSETEWDVYYKKAKETLCKK